MHDDRYDQRSRRHRRSELAGVEELLMADAETSSPDHGVPDRRRANCIRALRLGQRLGRADVATSSPIVLAEAMPTSMKRKSDSLRKLLRRSPVDRPPDVLQTVGRTLLERLLALLPARRLTPASTTT
jgi:hypothetical protein